ncbi:protein-arginine deiminase [Kribbella amoyensis]|uniref:Protein-arginine deiminase n=1 Tax=Kribbella amoyensis TaxID=996641 RepID=A0A561BR93_9ACTN|nr:protein-arginine deiminase family protein [Kribbella amoyensis]TWD81417.1 protein-arginine deiminase [Kribbella amoyensis]
MALLLAAPLPPVQPATDLLRADTNRDGVLTAADDQRAGRPIMLANLDDDQSRCPKAPSTGRFSDQALAVCNDAADDQVNGARDLRDLAPLEIRPARGTGRLLPDRPDKARVFIQREGRFVPLGNDPIELSRGARLAVEARDVVRDPAAWSGQVTLTLAVDGRRDQLTFQVAPVLFQHDLMPLRRAVVANTSPPAGLESAPRPTGNKSASLPGEAEYRRDLRKALDAEGLRQPFVEWPAGGDQWLGDMYKTAYMSLPGPGGTEHRMTVNLRSPAVPPEPPSRDRPLRDASRPVFTLLRGPDVAGIQEFDPARIDTPEDNLFYGSASSTGNFGTIPPTPEYPLGRIVYGGAGKFRPDDWFTRMLKAQGHQDPLMVDTTWLGVGHLDEFLHFVPADNRQGWVAVVADPALGWRLLHTVAGDQLLVQGVDPAKTDHPGLTVKQALELPELIDGTRIATAGVARALKQLGLTEQQIVRVPALFKKLEIPAGYPRDNLTVTALPDAANGISTGTGAYLAPRQHGPRKNGRDVYEHAVEQALGRVGVRTRWVEDWDYAHHVGTAGGELHCVTNVERDLRGTARWWD